MAKQKSIVVDLVGYNPISEETLDVHIGLGMVDEGKIYLSFDQLRALADKLNRVAQFLEESE